MKCTGLPIKDETLEMTVRNVRNVCFLMFLILCNCKLICLFVKSLSYYITKFEEEDLFLPWDPNIFRISGRLYSLILRG